MAQSRKPAKPDHNQRVRASSQRRRAEEKRSLREAILQAAAELFIETPNGDFSLRQVAERVGYTATTIYLYFKDKEDLLFAICDQGFETFDLALREAYQNTPEPLERITAMGRAYINFGLSHPAHYRTMFHDKREYLLSSTRGEEQPKMASLLLLQKAVQEAIHAGWLTDQSAQTTADILWAAVHGVVSFGNGNPSFAPERTTNLMEGMLSFLHRGMSHQ